MDTKLKKQDQHDHQRVKVTTTCPDCGQELAQQTFNKADIEQQEMSELPNREAMSLVNANVAAPINAALALNVLSDGSIAAAGAYQYAPTISAAGRPVNPVTIRALIAQMLIPRGLVEMADGSVAPVATNVSSPLALNMRMKMIRPETIMPITGILRWVYWPPVLLAVVV